MTLGKDVAPEAHHRNPHPVITYEVIGRFDIDLDHTQTSPAGRTAHHRGCVVA